MMAPLRQLATLLLPAAASAYIAGALSPRIALPPSIAVTGPGFAPLEINPLQDAATRLKSASVQWAASRLAGSAFFPPEDLMLALVSPEAFWLLREWRSQAFGQQEVLRGALDDARRQISRLSREASSPLRGAAVRVRQKGLWSTFHKATVRAKAVHDVLAVRVVLPDGADAYAALAEIRALWPSVPGRFKDYVARPKVNSYQGLHDTLRLPDGSVFEIQVRTESMHREAEFGHASHRKYKASPGALAGRMLTGIADGHPTRWPLQPQTALALAAKLS